jgi:hypothetical protein
MSVMAIYQQLHVIEIFNNHCGRLYLHNRQRWKVSCADIFLESWKSNLILLMSGWFSSSGIYG